MARSGPYRGWLGLPCERLHPHTVARAAGQPSSGAQPISDNASESWMLRLVLPVSDELDERRQHVVEDG